MAATRSSETGGASSVYLVERYVPADAMADLADSVARVAGLCALTEGGESVRYLQSLYLPSEEICFCVFQGRSADAVRSLNASGRLALDRITPAVLMHGGVRHLA